MKVCSYQVGSYVRHKALQPLTYRNLGRRIQLTLGPRGDTYLTDILRILGSNGSPNDF
jgi:hypothetical protein